MIKCNICGRTPEECWTQDGTLEIKNDGSAFICGPCQEKINDKNASLFHKMLAISELRMVQTELVRNSRQACLDYIVKRIEKLKGE